MKKRLILVAFSLMVLSLVFINLVSATDNVQWVKAFNGTGYTYGGSTATDSNGNVFVTGSMTGDLQIGNVYIPSLGPNAAFIAKFDSNGNVLWAKGFGNSISGSSVSFGGDGIAIDQNGDVYLTGSIIGVIPFGIYNIGYSGGSGSFLLKLNGSDGNVLRVQSFGNGGGSYGLGVAVDKSNGNVAVTGDFKGVISFGVGITTNSFGYQNIFVVEFDSNGNYLWSKNLGFSGNSQGSSIAIDNNGNVGLTGFTTSTPGIDLGGGRISTKYRYNQPCFISMYNSSGGYLWGKMIESSNYNCQNGISVRFDSGGNLMGAFSVGYITADFGNDVNVTLNSGGVFNSYLAKFSNAGVTQWATGIGSSGGAVPIGLTLDSSGNFLISGSYSGANLIAGNYILNNVGDFDAYIVKINSSGTVINAKTFGGNGKDQFAGISYANDGSYYSAGNSLSSNVGFCGINKNFYGAASGFLMKISTGGASFGNYHPADVNQDGTINSTEANNYNNNFKQGLDFNGLGIPSISYATRANYLFAKGRNYTYNASIYCPGCWDNGTWAAQSLPPAPIGLTTGIITNSSISFLWNSVSGATSYNVYRSTDGNSYILLQECLLASYYNDTNLLPGKNYYYKVSAVVNGVETSQAAITMTTLKFIPILSISISPGVNVIYGTQTTITGNGCPSELTCTLTRKGQAVSNPDVQILTGGTYTYSYSTLGDENYTSATSNSVTINVNYSLSVKGQGTGTGTITSSVGGINCGNTCSASLGTGTQLTLTATPNGNSIFTGWVGDCSGTGTCSLTMNGNKNVNTTFTLLQFDYSLIASPITTVQGGTAYQYITIIKNNAAAQSVTATITISDLPSGVSLITSSSQSCAPNNGACSLQFNYSISPTAVLGSTSIGATGLTSGLADKSSQFILTIANSGPVSKPTGLINGTAITGAVNLTWDPIPGISYYRVRRGTFGPVVVGIPSTNSFIDTSATTGSYSVAAINSTGSVSLYSSSVSV